MRIEKTTEKDRKGNDYEIVRIFLDSGQEVRVDDKVLVVHGRRANGEKTVELLYRLAAWE
jgi:hypothetical protein